MEYRGKKKRPQKWKSLRKEKFFSEISISVGEKKIALFVKNFVPKDFRAKLCFKPTSTKWVAHGSKTHAEKFKKSA